MTIAVAKDRLKQAYQENDWVTIIALILRFGVELIAYLRELKAEKKKSLEEKEK